MGSGFWARGGTLACLLAVLLACKKSREELPPPAPVPAIETPAAPAAAPPAPTPTPTPPTSAYAVGDKVDVEWQGSWWQAKVTAVDGTRYRVHYVGWDSSWDEWVGPRRIRAWTGRARSK